MANCFTDTIKSTDFIGDSLDTINANFKKLATVGCELSSTLNGVVSFGITSITGGNKLQIKNSGSTGIISELIAPVWHVGGTRLPLNTETGTNKVSEAITLNANLLKSLQDTAKSNILLYETVSYVAQTSAVFPGNNAFRGGINLFDGRVFFPSSTNTSTAYIYDNVTERVEPLIGFPSTTTDSFWGSVLLSDGRVFCIPHNSTSAVIYTPYEVQTGSLFTTTNTGGTYPGNEAYLGGTLLKDGRVLLCPYNTNAVAIVDTVTGTKTTVPINTGTGAVYSLKSFYGCALTYNGKVFFVPNNTSTYWVLNASNNTMTAVNNTAPGGDAFRGAVTLSDGRVFCVPYNSTYAAIYNPANDSIFTTGNIFPGSGAFETGTLLPDGSVFLVPSVNGFPGIYNPFDNTLEITSINIAPNQYYGSLLTVNNRLMLCPRDSVTGMLISVPYTNEFPRTIYTNPLFNKL